jgi:hypothetical protein
MLPLAEGVVAMRRAFSVGSIAVLAAVFVSCGGGRGDSADTSESSTTRPQPSRTAPSTTSSTVLASPYTTQPVQFTTSAGWIYEFIPDLGRVTAKVAKDVQMSPPGEARFISSSLVEDAPNYPGEVRGATPGRTPPDTKIDEISAYWPLGVAPSQAQDLIDIANFGGGDCAVRALPFVTTDAVLSCRPRPDVGQPTSFYDYPEATVDQILGLATAAVTKPPYIAVFVAVNDFETVIIVFGPDGTARVVPDPE